MPAHRPAVATTRAPALIAVMAAAVLAGPAASVAAAHGEAVDVVVEALVRTGPDLGRVDFGIGLTFADGHPVEGAQVVLTAVTAPGTGSSHAAETVPGVWIGHLEFPEPGTWRVGISFVAGDVSGSVEFSQLVDEGAPPNPVVQVDTKDPARVGVVVTDASGLLGPASLPPVASGDDTLDVVVEAFIADAVDPLFVEYAMSLSTAEGSPVDASVTMTFASDGDGQIDPVTLEIGAGGIYRGAVLYPTAALWTVTVVAQPVDSSESMVITFAENLPWPHYTTEAGHPKVKFDSSRPDRVGTIASPDESVYLAAGAVPPEPSAPTPPATAPTGGGVVLDLPGPAAEIRRDLLLRMAHLTALGLWLVPVVAIAAGHRRRAFEVLAIVGAVATLGSGIALTLWGAPISYPGIWRWSELGDRFYGESYQMAFVIKMTLVAVAAAATGWLAMRRRRDPALIVLAAAAGALLAVMAMGQFHLFSHL